MQEHEREGVNIRKGTHPWWIKGYAAWTRVTHDQVISKVGCEVVYALLTAGQSATAATLYNGDGTGGDPGPTIEAEADHSKQMSPAEPIYFSRGLYVDVDSNIGSLFIMWRPIPTGWRV